MTRPHSNHQHRGPHLSRRSMILGGASLAIGAPALAACSSQSEPTIPDVPTEAGALIAAFPQSAPHVPVGVPTRLPYLITDGEGVPREVIEAAIPFVVARDGETVAEYEVAPHANGVPRAYLPLKHTFEHEGIYDITATYDNEPLTSHLQVFPATDVVSPVVGQQLPPAPTATVEETLDVDPICTLVPPCEFHSVNLADAVDGGKPIVLLVATPAYCQTAFCGPTLGNLIDIVGDRDDITVIHSEVYRAPKEAKGDLASAPLAPLPEKYGLLLEPVMYVTDSAGAITTRADVMIDRTEMEEVIP